MPAPRIPLEQRFWPKVDRQGPDECWPWVGRRNHAGYGRLWWEGRAQLAHRVAWQLTTGPIPEGLSVLHKCDFPACCRPAHLFLGTIADNNADRDRKGRTARMPGASNPRTDLSDEDIMQIRARLQNGEYRSDIARDFSLSAGQISQIGRGATWGHLPTIPRSSWKPKPFKPFNVGSQNPNAKLSEAAIRDIRNSPLNGITLAGKHNVSKALISRIRNRKSWAHV
jgi:hypothetical protein